MQYFELAHYYIADFVFHMQEVALHVKKLSFPLKLENMRSTCVNALHVNRRCQLCLSMLRTGRLRNFEEIAQTVK